MAKKYLDYDGLLYFWQKIKTVFVPNTRTVNGKALSTDITLTASDVSALPSSTTIPSPGTGSSYPAMDGTRALGTNAGYARVDHVHPSDTTKVDKVSGKGLSTNDYTTEEKNKLSGIAAGAEVNQNAFSNITVGNTTIEADAKTDTLTLEAGSGIAITPDATNDKVTIAFNGTIPTLPNNFGTVKVGSTNVVADTTSDTLELVAGSNVTLTPDATNDKVTIAATNTTYSDFTGATSDAAGTHGLVPAPAAGAGAGLRVLTAAGGFETLDLDVRTGVGVPKPLVIELTVGDSGHVLNVPVATTEADGAMSADDKSKLNGISEGAQVNQNAFSNVAVGSTTIAADTKTDTLTLVGSNVTLTPDASADKVTIGITASNVTTALSNTAVARAAADGSGNNIAYTYAPKASPALSGTPTAPTAAAGTNTTQIATTAFVTSAIQTAQTGAATFQGTAPTSFAPTNYKKGYYWVVGTAGTYVTQTCEPGDMIFAVKDYASAYAASDFNVIQTNLDITSIPNTDIDTIVAS